ncbi:MAG: cation:proton antiporter [Phycisphaeraceae bacterium]
MFDHLLIQTIGVIIVTAAAAVLIARQVQIPSIVAYLIAGLLLGPVLGVLPVGHGHGPESEAGAVDIVAEIGIILLLFLVGLELSFDKVRDVGKVAVAAGLGQVIFTAIGGFIIAWLLGFAVIEAVFLSIALTFSSTVVVVKVLDQKGELDSLYGRIAVGIFLVQDMVVIIMLTVLTGLGTAEAMNVQRVTWGILQAFGGMALVLGVAVVAGRYLLARPFGWISRSPWALSIWSLCLCFGFVALARGLGLSQEIGAFLAGLSLAQLGCSADLRRRVHPLMNFFVAIFFVTLGAQMQLGEAVDQWVPGLVLSLFVLIGNPFIFMWIIARFGYGERTSFMTSVTVAQISEFSFVFAALGLSAGLIDTSILSLIALVGLVTIVASVYMILYSQWLYGIVRRWGLLRMFGARPEEPAAEEHGPGLRGHVIVVGMNALGQRLARALHERGETVLAIDTDPAKLAPLPCRTMLGNVDYQAVLDDAALSRARLAVTALQIEDTNRLFVYRCRELGVPVAAHGFDRSVLADLRALHPAFMIDSKAAADARLEARLREVGVLSG